MSERYSKSFKIAYCGIVSALSVVIMLAALIPSMTYVLPALLSYAVSAILCFMIVPEIEADLYYLFFFGYYPLIRDLTEKVKPKILSYIVKFLIFNAAVVIAFQIVSHIMNLEQILEGLEMFGEMAVYVLWGASNVAFLLYDLCLDYLFYGFRKWLKPKINKKIRKG